ncbi:MAG: SRPBCC family protein [Actinomycetota bacterium]
MALIPATTTVGVDVARPVAEVFPFAADFRNDPTWRTEVVTSELVAGEPPGVGARYDQVLTVLGREIHTSFEVVECVPGRILGFAGSSGPLDVAGSLVFVPTSDRTTRLLFGHRMSGPLWFAAVEPWLARRRRRGIGRDLDRLRRHLEGVAASP